jgi:hypothetical protein
MLFSQDFRKLLLVCLKMLFRKSTRKRFVFLVVAFLFMMGFNTCGYVKKFHKTETLKREVLDEKAFKIFFMRMRTRNNLERFLNRHSQKLQQLGSETVKKAFVYQNNLFVHVFSPSETSSNDRAKNRGAMDLLYDVYHIRTFAGDFYVKNSPDEYTSKVRNSYVDHNGAGLSKRILAGRKATLKFDLIDIADMIRDYGWDKRIDVYNSLKTSIIKNLNNVPLDAGHIPNPYLSRVESIVPMNFLHIFTNIKYDNTTDIMDLADSVRYAADATIEADKAHLSIPEMYKNKVMYADIDAYPRYIPLYVPEILTPRWNWLLYENIDLKNDFLDYIDQLHFQGHYLFSYEKSHILKDKVKKINDDIRSNHIHFYLIDLSMGIAFPFMISLFAFIHLKTELAFLLMFKNRIRELLFIFWLLPVFLMLLVKGGILTAYLLFLLLGDFGISSYLVLPLALTLLSAAAVFYPINKWCFSPFIGDSLNLSVLHKGR